MKTRTEKEMFQLINEFSQREQRIRVVLMNGSRANPHVQKDIFQDYDIACYVTDVEPYKKKENIFPYFGEILIVEQPNTGPWPPENADGTYHNYNMQFMDGNRIDLSFYPISSLAEHKKGSLTKILHDKDGLCIDLPPSSEKSYFISEPTKELYDGCCTAFFFALGSHIPKTIWRKKLPLLKYYMEGWLRVPVQLMLSWEIGLKFGYELSLGSNEKNLQLFLEPEKWEIYQKTYAGYNYDELWDSIFLFYEIFMETAGQVAKAHGYDFKKPEEEGKKVLSFLEHVRNLPENAQSIY